MTTLNPPANFALSSAAQHTNTNEKTGTCASCVNTACSLGKSLLSSARTKPLVVFAHVLGWTAVFSGVYQLARGLGQAISPLPQPLKVCPHNPASEMGAFLHNGTYGVLEADLSRLDGVMVARGDRLGKVVSDPCAPGAGMILSDFAQNIFGSLKEEAGFPLSPEAEFDLAVRAASMTRTSYLQDEHTLNNYASVHVRDSKGFKFGSPFVSLTMNNRIAAHFGLGGADNKNNLQPFNRDGRVFLGSINNASTVYPVVQRAIKNIDSSTSVGKVSDIALRMGKDIVPVAELLVLGGYYFYESVSLAEAESQNPKTFRKIPDLYDSSLSFQMIEKNHEKMRIMG